MDNAAREWLSIMHNRVARRPYLFEQTSIDIAVERAKQEAHDSFEAALRKHGLAANAGPVSGSS